MRIRSLALTGLAAAAVAYYFDPVKEHEAEPVARADPGAHRQSAAPERPNPTPRERGAGIDARTDARTPIVEKAPEVRPIENVALPEDVVPVSMPERPTDEKAPEMRPAEAEALLEDEGDAAIARAIRVVSRSAPTSRPAAS